MLVLVLIFVVLLASLAVLLGVGTLFLQGYIYSEPVANLQWRGPAAAGILVAFLALWTALDYALIDPNRPDIPLDTIFRFSPVETSDPVDEFWVERDIKGKRTLYRRENTGLRGTADYFELAPDGKAVAMDRPWRREKTAEGICRAIIVSIQGQEVRFEPRLQNGRFPASAEQFPGYYEAGGRRYMEVMGRVSYFRRGLFVANVLLNLVHFAVWFFCFWLILRFQWTHALGLAIVFWVTAILTIVPMLLDEAMQVKRERLSPSTALVQPLRQAWSVAERL